jgi:double-stranded uracil-DNA glycosylase
VSALHGLPPVTAPDARVLILGSFPGERSLAAAQYYAHPQNRFWRTLAPVVGFAAEDPYGARLEALRLARVAVWDVLASCERRGSLDTAIVAGTEVPNDFGSVLVRQRGVERVLFNGRKAAELFSRLVIPEEYWPDLGLQLRALPSTSPANAAVRLEGLRTVWGEAIAPT